MLACDRDQIGIKWFASTLDPSLTSRLPESSGQQAAILSSFWIKKWLMFSPGVHFTEKFIQDCLFWGLRYLDLHGRVRRLGWWVSPARWVQGKVLSGFCHHPSRLPVWLRLGGSNDWGARCTFWSI